MKVAGGLLMFLGAVLAIICIMAQQNAARYWQNANYGLYIIGGIALFFVGVIVFCIKPKNKKAEKLQQQALEQQIQLQQQQIQFQQQQIQQLQQQQAQQNQNQNNP